MFKPFIGLAALTAVNLFASVGVGIAAPTYTFFSAPDANATYPLGISAKGDIVGWYSTPAGIFGAFIRDHRTGKSTRIESPSGDYTMAMSISGDSVTGCYYTDILHAFIWNKNGDFVSFDPAGSIGTLPYAISNGWITGTAFDSNQVPFAFIRDQAGTVTGFSVTDASGSLPTYGTSVNRFGRIVGDYQDRATKHLRGYYRDPDGSVTLFDLPGHGSTRPITILDDGTITGMTAPGGFIRSPSGKYTVFQVKGRSAAYNSAKNAIVGYTGSKYKGQSFIADFQGRVELFEPPGANDSSAMDVNNAGEVTGNADLSGDPNQYGYLRKP